ncbi:hypothetical protein J4G37_18355 [Microvirga sp. 3-52]|nr:hypothetical protein [Microvirga sp. 3-52]
MPATVPFPCRRLGNRAPWRDLRSLRGHNYSYPTGILAQAGDRAGSQDIGLPGISDARERGGRLQESSNEVPNAEVAVVRLDPTSAEPQVVFSSLSAGAPGGLRQATWVPEPGGGGYRE